MGSSAAAPLSGILIPVLIGVIILVGVVIIIVKRKK